MADKPSRSLILYGDGLARFIDPLSSHTNLHSLASLSSCAFLTLSNSNPSGSFLSSLFNPTHTSFLINYLFSLIHLILCSFQKPRMIELLENSHCFLMHPKFMMNKPYPIGIFFYIIHFFHNVIS